MSRRFVFCDGNSIGHWRWHAKPAEVSLARSFDVWLRDQMKVWMADLVVVAFDGGNNWRNQVHKDYKMHRDPHAPELVEQLAMLPDVAREAGAHSIQVDTFEADDVLGTLVSRLRDDDKALVVVRDKDLCQLVRRGVGVLDPTNGKLYDTAAVVEKYGVHPRRIQEWLSLTGDKSDNIDGVPQWGDKRAARAIDQTSNFHDLLSRSARLMLTNLDRSDAVTERLQKTLNEFVPRVTRNMTLTKLREDVPVEVPI